MTLRLHAHYPSSLKDSALKKPFVTPNLVGKFENYLDLILEKWPESEKERKTLKGASKNSPPTPIKS